MADVIETLVKKLNDDGNVYPSIDDIRGVRNAFLDFGGAHPDTALVTLATAAPGATRGRVVAIYSRATAATNIAIRDGVAGTRIFPVIVHAAAGNLSLDKRQLGDGGIIFTTAFAVDPDANNNEFWVAWIPEYDAYRE